MTAQNGDRIPRRESRRASLRGDKAGGFTTHAAKMMAKPLGGTPAECTLTGQCRTFVFEFPRSKVSTGNVPKNYVIFEEPGMRAAIVGDLLAYFENKPGTSLHFDISASFRSTIHSVYEESVEKREREAQKLFLVIEEFTEFTPTSMSSDQCFLIDEVRDGEAIIVGGQEGEKALLAFPALGCPWPEIQPDMYRVNVILAAVKAVQDITGHITKLDESSCFVSSKREAVYTLNLTMSASGVAVSRLTPEDLEERAGRMAAMIESMMSEENPAAAVYWRTACFASCVSTGSVIGGTSNKLRECR